MTGKFYICGYSKKDNHAFIHSFYKDSRIKGVGSRQFITFDENIINSFESIEFDKPNTKEYEFEYYRNHQNYYVLTKVKD